MSCWMPAQRASRSELAREMGRSLTPPTDEAPAASTVTRDVSEAEAVLTLARQEYDTIAARVDGEMARFQSEKLADFKAMVVRLLELQIEYSERVVCEWEGLYPRASALDDR